jgi:hypothetical protein
MVGLGELEEGGRGLLLRPGLSRHVEMPRFLLGRPPCLRGGLQPLSAAIESN